VNEYAFFAQDAWRVNDKLTLNYGIHYDLFDYAQPSVKNPDSGLAAIGIDTTRINKDTNNLAARFGFAYKLDREGRTAIRRGYGNYYGRTPSILTGTAMSQNGIQVQTYTIFPGPISSRRLRPPRGPSTFTLSLPTTSSRFPTSGALTWRGNWRTTTR
jgi:hypothetical protein